MARARAELDGWGQTGLDPRTKLFLLLMTNIFMFLHCRAACEATLVALIAVCYLPSGHLLAAGRWIAIYLVLFTVDHVVTPWLEPQGALAVVAGFATSFRFMAPCMMAGTFAFTTTRPSELIAAMRRTHVPERWTIPVAVVMRYFPTLRRQYRDIADAMSLRGIAVTPAAMICHPGATVEHVLVPMLASATMTSDDLAVAAITKGVENPGTHSTATVIGFGAADAAVFLAGLVIFVAQVAF